MSDNKLLAILFACISVVTSIIVLTNTKKSDHEIRMEKIQELDAIREVMRKSESDIEMLKIKRQIESMRSEIEK
jgi:sensor domain CHASE-containing protein